MAQTARKIDQKPEFERLSTMAIAMRYHLTRETVLKRLKENDIEPVVDEPKKKLYEMTQELIAAVNKRSDAIDAVKLRHEEARAKLVEIKVAEKNREMVPVAEARDIAAAIFGKMFAEMAIQMPKRLATKLARSKSAAEVTKMLKNEVERVFKGLRENPEGFLK